MTIANGSAIALADINAMTTTALGNVRTDNAQLPIALEWTVPFRAMRSNAPITPEYARRAFLVAPRDLWLDTLTLKVHGLNGTTTATIEQEAAVGTALAFISATVSVVGAGAAATASAVRTLYDNTRASAKSALIPVNPVFRTVPKGTRMRMTLTTTNTLGSEHVWCTLVCREGYARP